MSHELSKGQFNLCVLAKKQETCKGEHWDMQSCYAPLTWNSIDQFVLAADLVRKLQVQQIDYYRGTNSP